MAEHPVKREKRVRLKAQRLAAGLSQKALAERIGVSVDTVRAWEQGRSMPYPRQHEPLRCQLGVSQVELVHLLDPSAPIVLNGHRVPRWFSHYESLVQAAGRVEMFEKGHMPGLLQTRAYATAIERYGPLELTDEHVSERVDRRMARQGVLTRDGEPLALSVIVTEHMLRASIGGPEVMAGQLDHLLDAAALPNVTLLVVPDDGHDACAPGSFQLLSALGEAEPFLSVTFDVTGPAYEERIELIAKFAAVFAYLAVVALPPDDSADHIGTIRRTIT
jgi:transcriptional regulator with XRE-family HTH domain